MLTVTTANKKKTTSNKEVVLQNIFFGERILKRKNAINHFDFHKQFLLSFPCCVTSFTKTNTHDVTRIQIKTYIHSLPLEMLFFYMTEAEYRFVNSFQTATVDSVAVNVHNMGVSSTEHKQNHSFGIWRGLEKYGPTKFGENLTPQELYGSLISKLPETQDFTTIPLEHVGATAEFKVVDNRMSYEISTKNSETVVKELDIDVPPFIGMAIVKVNATKNIGQLYRTTYKPKYGMIQDKSFPPKKMFVARQDKIIYPENNHFTQNSYEDATIEDHRLGPRVDGLGVGLFPTRLGDGVVEAYIELCVQTEIRIRVENIS